MPSLLHRSTASTSIEAFRRSQLLSFWGGQRKESSAQLRSLKLRGGLFEGHAALPGPCLGVRGSRMPVWGGLWS